jgi:hypothetical protein
MTKLELDVDRVTRLAAAAGVVYTAGAESLAHDLRMAAGTGTLAARDDDELTRLLKGLKPVSVTHEVSIRYPELNRGLPDPIRAKLGALDLSTLTPATRLAEHRKAERAVAADLAADNTALAAPVGPKFEHLHGKDKLVAFRLHQDGLAATKARDTLMANFDRLSGPAKEYARGTLAALDKRIAKAKKLSA